MYTGFLDIHRSGHHFQALQASCHCQRLLNIRGTVVLGMRPLGAGAQAEPPTLQGVQQRVTEEVLPVLLLCWHTPDKHTLKIMLFWGQVA
jgi:hypothetical protein